MRMKFTQNLQRYKAAVWKPTLTSLGLYCCSEHHLSQSVHGHPICPHKSKIRVTGLPHQQHGHISWMVSLMRVPVHALQICNPNADMHTLNFQSRFKTPVNFQQCFIMIGQSEHFSKPSRIQRCNRSLQNAAMHRLEAITGIRKSPSNNDRHCISQIRLWRLPVKLCRHNSGILRTILPRHTPIHTISVILRTWILCCSIFWLYCRGFLPWFLSPWYYPQMQVAELSENQDQYEKFLCCFFCLKISNYQRTLHSSALKLVQDSIFKVGQELGLSVVLNSKGLDFRV
jgi:hypothetical protein